MGIYPLLQSKNIKREYGGITLVLGAILLIRGLLDINLEFFHSYLETSGFFDVIIVIAVLLVLISLIIKIFSESITLYMERDKDSAIDKENGENNTAIENKDIEKNTEGSKTTVDDENIVGSNNRTIKSDKTSTMSKNKDFFKR
jgi:hypothetical protein